MPYLLDTNHCFRLIARDVRMFTALQQRPLDRLMTSVVVAGELRYGALISERQIENSRAVEDFLGRIDQVAISPAISQAYADLKAAILLKLGPKDRVKRRSFALTKLGFTDNDLWIAASALDREAIVVSEDPDFRRMATLESLKVENWLS
jgi:tRNA(fMet)-specific endonuclease VapC